MPAVLTIMIIHWSHTVCNTTGKLNSTCCTINLIRVDLPCFHTLAKYSWPVVAHTQTLKSRLSPEVQRGMSVLNPTAQSYRQEATTALWGFPRIFDCLVIAWLIKNRIKRLLIQGRTQVSRAARLHEVPCHRKQKSHIVVPRAVPKDHSLPCCLELTVEGSQVVDHNHDIPI